MRWGIAFGHCQKAYNTRNSPYFTSLLNFPLSLLLEVSCWRRLSRSLAMSGVVQQPRNTQEISPTHWQPVHGSSSPGRDRIVCSFIGGRGVSQSADGDKTPCIRTSLGNSRIRTCLGISRSMFKKRSLPEEDGWWVMGGRSTGLFDHLNSLGRSNLKPFDLWTPKPSQSQNFWHFRPSRPTKSQIIWPFISQLRNEHQLAILFSLSASLCRWGPVQVKGPSISIMFIDFKNPQKSTTNQAINFHSQKCLENLKVLLI